MRARLLLGAVRGLWIAFGIPSAGWGARLIVADPRGNVTLASPYHPAYPGAPTNKISVQYAVIAVAMRVGLGYDFGTSLKNEDPVFMQWIPPEIVRRPFPQAMEMILKPVNLSCSVLNGKIVLDGRS